ncbi:hypothetical protein ABVN80_01950 [Acinetobacter baumannii]
MPMQFVKYGHSFRLLNEDGQVSIINTKGNPYVHVVLRGGNGKSNSRCWLLLQKQKTL